MSNIWRQVWIRNFETDSTEQWHARQEDKKEWRTSIHVEYLEQTMFHFMYN